MTPKVKTILTVCVIVASFPVLTMLLILFRDYLNIIAIVVLFLTCLGLTVYGLYEVVYEEINRRHKLHEELYFGKSAEVRRWLDFFLDYFGLEELK
jgi:hypothetical protein